MGNLCGMVATLAAVSISHQMGRPPLVSVAAGLILGVLVFHFTGLFANAQMRKQLAEVAPPEPRFFVGFATAGYQGALDPHEDVGWLSLQPDKLAYVGEKFVFDVGRSQLDGLRTGAGIHSLVGGGWIVLEGSRDRQRFVLRFESRETDRVFGLHRANLALRQAISTWLNAPPR